MTVTELIVRLLDECSYLSKDPARTDVRLSVCNSDLSHSMAEASFVWFNKDDNGDISITDGL